ncbi:DUF4436 domain-containing protein [Kitasatospora kazusensis]|uniref:DUF4436 domain-containing protein n=1 Tax=Kitasatospora kazusensis TaxID=407974 RepID=A0ABP5KIF4_9ACTN
MTTAGPGRRGVRQFVVLALIAALCGTGIALYFDERDSRQQTRELGARPTGDWVELDITAQEVRPATQELTLAVVPIPHGTLAGGPPDAPVFTRDVDIAATALTKPFQARAGEPAELQLIPVGMSGGTPSDYPFDHYTVSVGWSASAGGSAVPVALTFTDSDPFFVVRPKNTGASGATARLDSRVSRSRSTFILAWFMIAAMWALALAVLGGAEVLIRKRQGLVWPALGWMAATLFALVGLRNAAPGSPPIGSLMDYIAFFWAEGIIAASLTCTAAFGIRHERRLMEE